MKCIVALPLILLIAAGLTGCSSAPIAKPTLTQPETFTALGTVDVPLNLQDAIKASGGPAQGQPCEPKAAYADVLTERVQVKDAAGKTVALGELGDGTLQPQAKNTMVLFARCRLTFSIPEVPVGKFFSVHVGDESREPAQFSQAELKAGAVMSLAKDSELNN